MQRIDAAERADEIINLLLTNQPKPLGECPLIDERVARSSAQALAAFRQELIAQLIQQQ
jgi:hypothetical protein